MIYISSLYIKIQNLVMLKVEKLRHDCCSDKCKKGVVHWCVLMGEMRAVADVLVIYGLDPEPDLTTTPNKGDKTR